MLSTGLEDLRRKDVLTSDMTSGFPLFIMAEFSLVTFRTRRVRMSISIRLLRVFRDVFTVLHGLRFPRVPGLLQLFPPVPRVSSFHDLRYPGVGIICVVNLALRIRAAAVGIGIRHSQLKVEIRSTRVR